MYSKSSLMSQKYSSKRHEKNTSVMYNLCEEMTTLMLTVHSYITVVKIALW